MAGRWPPLSTGEAATVAGCHAVTVWRAIRAGELEAVRLGPTGAYRVTLEAIDEWLRPVHEEPAP